MIEITGIKKTPIYRYRVTRRIVIERITEIITQTGRVDHRDVKHLGAVLPILDKQFKQLIGWWRYDDC